MPLALASASPRRRELLALLGIDLVVRPARVDEERSADPARAKAVASWRRGEAVLAADTRIDLDGEWLTKPASPPDAVAMLARLAARAHDVATDVTVIDATGRRLSFRVLTRVRMRAFDAGEAAAYVATGEPLDAAGAYQVQGGGGALVDELRGCYANVVGFPLCHAYEALRRVGAAARERPEEACQRRFAFTCPVWQHARAQGRALRDGAVWRSWTDAP